MMTLFGYSGSCDAARLVEGLLKKPNAKILQANEAPM
jgi:hypothetical protein